MAFRRTCRRRRAGRADGQLASARGLRYHFWSKVEFLSGVGDPAGLAAVDEGMNARSDSLYGAGRGAKKSGASYMTLADDRSAVPSPEELAELIRRVAARGDRQAFAALFRFYAPRLKSFLGRQGYGEVECEDLVQEAMLNIWRRASSFDPAKAGASTWIYTIARNLGIDRRRRDGKGASWRELTTVEEADPDPSVEARMIAVESESRVRHALRTLPDEQAAVIRMTFYGEDPQAEIARTLGIPLGTVKSRVRLALARLRKTMEDGS
jgi:RNA polymerase sigma-70 factor (ECF subfamily)